jgi:hypothetical protein
MALVKQAVEEDFSYQVRSIDHGDHYYDNLSGHRNVKVRVSATPARRRTSTGTPATSPTRIPLGSRAGKRILRSRHLRQPTTEVNLRLTPEELDDGLVGSGGKQGLEARVNRLCFGDREAIHREVKDDVT